MRLSLKTENTEAICKIKLIASSKKKFVLTCWVVNVFSDAFDFQVTLEEESISDNEDTKKDEDEEQEEEEEEGEQEVAE